MVVVDDRDAGPIGVVSTRNWGADLVWRWAGNGPHEHLNDARHASRDEDSECLSPSRHHVTLIGRY